MRGNSHPALAGAKNVYGQTSSHVNVIVLGSDGNTANSVGKLDTVMVWSLDTQNHKIEELAIPPSTLVTYPDGHTGQLEDALQFGGPQLAVRLVNRITQRPIAAYVLLHYEGFTKVVDRLGGVPMNVKQSMHYRVDNSQYGNIDLRSGTQTLTGKQALEFVRFQSGKQASWGRILRQQAFVSSAFHTLTKKVSPASLPSIVETAWKDVQSNISAPGAVQLFLHSQEILTWPTVYQIIPGAYRHDITTGTVWQINTNKASEVLAQLYNNGRVVKWSPAQSRTHHVSHKQTTATTVMVVNASSAYIRSGPGQTYQIVGSAAQGDKVSLLGSSGTWDKVETSTHQVGYIANWLLKPADATTAQTTASSNQTA